MTTPLKRPAAAALLPAMLAMLAGGALAQAGATPRCDDLAADPAFGLAGQPGLRDLAAVRVPATARVPAHCQVDLTDVTLEGPAYGYLPGQTSRMRIRIGLPLNERDGGSGGVQGAWNGRIQSRGNGGFAGAVSAVTPAVLRGYVGTGTDTGHDASITRPVQNPNAPPPTVEEPPSEAGAAFGLNPDRSLNEGRILDWAWRSQHHANLWGQRVARLYYGRAHERNYFVGCSDGGREGHEMAQRFGALFDGVVAMSPALHWDRWGLAAGYGNHVAHELLGRDGLPGAKVTDVNRRAAAACDALDGLADGVVQDPRRCTYDARSAVCGEPGAAADPALCLTPQEAQVVNAVWQGPHTREGRTLWPGFERGTFNPLGLWPPERAAPSLFGEEVNRYWMHQSPFFDWRRIDRERFVIELQNLERRWSPVIGSDGTDYGRFRERGGRLIAAYGTHDQVIPPAAHAHYVQRLFAADGGAARTQSYYRYFVFPHATHCRDGGMTEDLLFNALVDWVEHGRAPDHLVARMSPTRTRKVCPYPDAPRHDGRGSIDDEASFRCEPAADEAAMLARDRGLLRGSGPMKPHRDIERLPAAAGAGRAGAVPTIARSPLPTR